MASGFADEIQKEIMSIPGAFSSLLTHIPQLVGLTGTVWLMRKGEDALDGAFGYPLSSGYNDRSMGEQFFRASEEALSFVIKLKYSMITGLQKVDPMIAKS